MKRLLSGIKLFLSYLLIYAINASAIEQKVDFNIISQPLDQALRDVSVNSSMQLLYLSKHVKDHVAPPIQGVFTLEEALNALLQNTELSYRLYENHTIIIKTTNNEDTKTLPTNIVNTSRHVSSTELEEIIVVDTPLSRVACCENTPSTSTKTYVPIMEVPRSIESINSQLFKYRGNIDLGELLQDYSSVNISDATGNTNIRGFELTDRSILKDGHPSVSHGITAPLLQSIDGIEVAKGANSTLYGYGEPGGVINLISKRPERQEFMRLGLTGGDHDYSLSSDINRPAFLNDDLSLRTNLFIRKQRSHDESNESSQILFAPIFQYRVDEVSSLLVKAEYNRQKIFVSESVNLFQGFDIPHIGAGFADDSTVIIDPREKKLSFYSFANTLNSLFPHRELKPRQFTLSELLVNYETILDSGWGVSAGAYYGKANQTLPQFGNPSFALFGGVDYTSDNFFSINDFSSAFHYDGGTLLPIVSHFRKYQRSVDINLNRRFTLFNLEHEFLVGYSYFDNRAFNYIEQDTVSTIEVLQATGKYINVDSALLQVLQVSDIEDTLAFSIKNNRALSYGVYLEDYISLSSQVRLQIGLGIYRYRERYTLHANNMLEIIRLSTEKLDGLSDLEQLVLQDNLALPSMTAKQARSVPKETVYSPRIGLTYLLNPSTAIYANFAHQFNIRHAVDGRGNGRDAEDTEAYEVGAKWWPTPDLQIELATFHQTKQNWETTDHDLARESLVGKLQSKGVELNLLGYITPHWGTAFNFAQHNLDVLEGNPYASNTYLSSRTALPTKNASFWLQYHFQPYGEFGWSTAIGTTYLGSREVALVDSNTPYRVRLSNHHLVDFSLIYQNRDLKMAFNIDNVFNKDWLVGFTYSPIVSSPGPLVAKGHGLRVRLSAELNF